MTDKMSFKKKSKKSPTISAILGSNMRNPPSIVYSTTAVNGASAPTNGGGSASGELNMPDGARAKLLNLFGQIELQFEMMYGENSACKLANIVSAVCFEIG